MSLLLGGVGPCTSVALTEGRDGTVREGIETWGGSGFTLAGGEGTVGLVEVLNGHDEFTAHDVELMLTLESSGNVGSLGSADTETELIEPDLRSVTVGIPTHERHPLLVENIGTTYIGGDVSTHGVAFVFGSVGVELTTSVTLGDVHFGTVPEAVDLNVEGSFNELLQYEYKLPSCSVCHKDKEVLTWAEWIAPSGMRLRLLVHCPRLPRNHSPSSVTRLGAVSDDNGLNVADQRLGSLLGRTVDAEVVDAVEGDETRHGGLVDLGTNRVKLGLVGVGGAIGAYGCDLSTGRSSQQGSGGDERPHYKSRERGV